MFPGYRNMDPYTQHLHHPWEHIPSPYHYYPKWEPTPIHMKTDSFNHPSACGPCPYNNQVEHESCCNRSHPTGYCSFRPPYFHYQHPPQMYYHSPYPSYQNAYPPLFIPPRFDHARCDYDIDKNHCCGCPNHNSHGKEGSNVKIEEQNTSPTIDEGPATTPKGNHSSLIQFPYNYYPMMWHPENSTRDGKTEKKTESLPMLNFKDNLKDLRQGQGESTHQGDNKVLQLPYPIFCLPGNGKPEEPVKDKKEIDATPKVAEDWPSKLKIVPLKLLGNENVVEKPGVLEEETKTQHSEKESKIKTIPVMHLDSSSGEKLSMADRPEDVLKNSVTEEKKYDAEIKKGGKKQPSPQKSSKLPPVCLRVEPLPKKNGSNGKGRSPSLLSLKDKVKPHEGNLGDAAIMNKDSDNTTKDIKVIDVDYQPSGEGGKYTDAAIVSGLKGIEEQCGEKDRNVVTTEVGVQVKGNVGGNKEEREDIPISQQRMIERERGIVDTSDNYKKQVQKKYSPEDAALLIQSAFRGFNVRRWKPLDKLQKIAQIRGKLNDVKSQIQNYEGSLELDVKQKVIISETIMNLLLQLDTIQGLHPSLRDIRKSVARDLVCLQDKLDQLYGQATNEHEEGTQKKDESSSSTSDASEITLTPEEKDLPSAGSHTKEKILSEQPSQYLKVENEFLQESEGSPMACQHDSVVSDIISDAVLEDAVKEPVGQSHIIPLKVLNDEMVPFGEQCYWAPQHEDENDRQVDNLASAEGNASMIEKYVNQDVLALPPESRVLDFVMKQQPDSDHTKWKEMQALKEQDLNDVECDSKHENPSISLSEEQTRNEEFMAVKPNEANKQSLFEVIALKEKSESKKEANSDEGATIKPEDVTVIRNDEALEEKNNVVGDAFVVSEELKTAFKHAGKGDRSEEYQPEPDSLAAMYPIQSSDAWKEETQTVEEDSEMSGYSKTEAKLCVKSAAIGTAVHNNNSQELAEVSSEIQAAETSIIASTDRVGVDSLEFFKSGAMDNESILLEASVCDTGLKETASYSINAMGSESNSKDSSQETRSCTQHEKSLPGDFVNSEIISEEKKLVEDNEKLRQMLEKLLNAGQEQMGVIAELNERVKNLEKKISKRKKVKVNKKKLNKFSHVVVGKDKVMSHEKASSAA